MNSSVSNGSCACRRGCASCTAIDPFTVSRSRRPAGALSRKRRSWRFPMRWLLSLSFLIVALPRVRADEPLAYPPPAQVRAAFLKLLDRPKVPAEPKLVSTKSYSPGWMLEQLSIASENKADGTTERVPMLILRPEETAKKLPAVIVLHGTGGAMQGQLPFMKELAVRNIIGVAIDARYHGERSGGAK